MSQRKGEKRKGKGDRRTEGNKSNHSKSSDFRAPQKGKPTKPKGSSPKPKKGPDPDRLTRRNTVLEALRANRRRFKVLYMQADMQDKLARPIRHAAKEASVRIEEVDRNRLGNLAGAGDHQGVVLEVGDYPYCEVFEILEYAKALEERPLILIMDLVQGTYNVGTLLRTAEIVGVHGVILQDRRAPEITPLIVQHSQGAAEHLRIAQVTNLNKAIDELKAADVWITGLDFGEDAQKLGSIDLDRPLAIVVGHEGDGIRRLVRDSCDFILEIPQRGNVESLNAAVAGSVALYAAWQARGF
ncbi:MAG: 23S rRNA (guanosine(2251)-2'-O)-methyltransferase RlmB [Anaerolineae bacterium]